jgi:regulator of protease activity HflC (stomatin/prohibitin superfamily)
LQVINGAAKTWGLECLRYEIKDILPPPAIVKAMELQAEAERRKRAQVLESEGIRQATINESEAQRVRFQSVLSLNQTQACNACCSFLLLTTSQECCVHAHAPNSFS